MPVDLKYRTSATACGGRDGHVRSEDGGLDLRLSTPKELGGAGGAGTNPEQLFASGFAACFLSTLKSTGSQLRVTIPDETTVTALVGIGTRGDAGFGLEVELLVSLPNMHEPDALFLIETAHEICPCSIATRGNVEVRLTLA